jgi:hypothetical protein
MLGQPKHLTACITMIGDPKVLVISGNGAGVVFGREMLLAITHAFAPSVGNDIRVGFLDSQRDPRLTTWAII